jgi:hypothetical protein
MWGKSLLRPAVGLRQIFKINFINTAGERRMKCGTKPLLDPLWDLDIF